MKLLSSSLLISGVLTISGCSDIGLNKQTQGAILGGASGALIGSQIGGGGGAIVATGIGAVGGALIGSEVGKSMDRQDKRY